MGLAAEAQKNFRRLMNEVGQNITHRRITQGAYDPATGATGASSTADTTVRGIFIDYQENEVDGTEIQRGDRKVIVASVDSTYTALGTVPQTNDQFIAESDTVSIVSVQPFMLVGTHIGYSCQVRE